MYKKIRKLKKKVRPAISGYSKMGIPRILIISLFSTLQYQYNFSVMIIYRIISYSDPPEWRRKSSGAHFTWLRQLFVTAEELRLSGCLAKSGAQDTAYAS